MLLLMIERGMPIDIVLTADTGMEFPEMYDHLAKLDEYLYRERGIHLTMLRHPKGFEYMMFEEEKQKISSIENRQKLGVPLYGNGWPGVKVRWCTGQLKTHLISKEVNRLKGEYQALHYVGIAADEPKRIKNEQYPLVDWGKGGIVMLINAIRAENLKSRHSNMWVAVLILPLLTAAIGAIIYGINASANLYDGAVWQQLWLQTGLFYGYFFFPILIAICASYLWRLEHTNHNWNSLMTTPVPRSTIFIAKLVVLAKSILAAQVLLMVFIIIVGKVVFRFEQPIPINMLWWLFMGWFSALSVGAVQLYLSMRIRSFAVPVGLAVCLSIGGLAFHIAGLSEMFPYSQIILGLSSQDEVLPIDSITTLVPMVLVYTVLFVILATNHLKKADVVAG